MAIEERQAKNKRDNNRALTEHCPRREHNLRYPYVKPTTKDIPAKAVIPPTIYFSSRDFCAHLIEKVNEYFP